MKPRFEHDCEECIFIGQYKEYDLYRSGTCNAGMPTLIARWGNDGPDYFSGRSLKFADIELKLNVDWSKVTG